MLRDKDSRELNATSNQPADFQIFLKTIQSILKCITNTFNDLFAKIGTAAQAHKRLAQRFFGEHQALLDKWINGASTS